MDKDTVGYSGAVNLFKQYYGAAVKIKSVSYDGKHHPYYEVEGYTQDAEKEMKISAETGEVISIKTDAPDKGREKKSIDTDGILPPQLVTAAALKKRVPLTRSPNGRSKLLKTVICITKLKCSMTAATK